MKSSILQSNFSLYPFPFPPAYSPFGKRKRETGQILIFAAINYSENTSIIYRERSHGLPKVEGEPYQLEQVMINLISNARDAMDKKWKKNAQGYGKKLILKMEKVNNEVWISVTDNGDGMTREERQRIFEPFFTTKEVGKATGLGMSISYGIIEAHKGTIEVESEKGKGTTIKVKLPVISGKA